MKIFKLTIISIIALLVAVFNANAIEPPAGVAGKDITSKSIKVEWGAVEGANKYEICSKEDKENYASSTVAVLFKDFTALTPKTAYYFKVRACETAADLSASDCESSVEHCSEFTSAKKYATLVGIEDLKLNYAKLYQKADAKLQKYKDYASEKLISLDPSSIADFSGEINVKANAMNAANVAIQGSADYNAVALALKKFNEDHDLSAFASKLKGYKRISGYYNKFDKFKEKINPENSYKSQFNAHIAGAKTVYQSYETQIKDADITDNAGIKNIYENLRNDSQYKFSALIYRQLSYLDKVNSRIDSLADKIEEYNFLAPTTKGRYDGLVDTATTSYSNFINESLWGNTNSYDAIKNIYQGMRKNGAYKNLAVVAKGLKVINKILEKSKDNYDSINKMAGAQGAIPAALKTWSAALYTSIKADLGDYENRILEPVNDPSQIYKDEIRTYQGYKVYKYFYAGSRYLIDLQVNKIDVLGSFIQELSCAEQEAMMAAFNDATASAVSAKDKLISFKLDGYNDIIKALYPDFKTKVKNSYNKYAEALGMALKCY